MCKTMEFPRTASTLISLHLMYKVFQSNTSPVCPRDGLPYSSLPGFVQQDSSPCLPSGSSLQDAVEDGYLAGTIYP